ncbi:hypothetical protein ACQP3J_31330, partial [Escherichia coli]
RYCPGKGLVRIYRATPQTPDTEGPWRPERIGTFLRGSIVPQAHIPLIAITWKNDVPVWVEQ